MSKFFNKIACGFNVMPLQIALRRQPGLFGKYTNRAMWRRLGWSRDRIFEVVVTDPVKAVIVSANLKASSGEN